MAYARASACGVSRDAYIFVRIQLYREWPSLSLECGFGGRASGAVALGDIIYIFYFYGPYMYTRVDHVRRRSLQIDRERR